MALDLRKDKTNFESNIRELTATIDLLLQRRLRMPSLILMYSLIDILSGLARPKSHENRDSTREDFIKWVDNFLIPVSRHKFTSIDLYSARCSMVHSYSFKSSLTRSSKAREMHYAWGSADCDKLNEIIEKRDRLAVAIHIEGFFEDLKKAISKYQVAIGSKSSFQKLVYTYNTPSYIHSSRFWDGFEFEI